MAEQVSSVVYKGLTYEVILDNSGWAWFIDPVNNDIKSRTNLGQHRKIYNIKEAKAAVLIMLESCR